MAIQIVQKNLGHASIGTTSCIDSAEGRPKVALSSTAKAEAAAAAGDRWIVPDWSSQFALVYAILGDANQMMARMARPLDQHMLAVPHHPLAYAARNEPLWQAAVQRVEARCATINVRPPTATEIEAAKATARGEVRRSARAGLSRHF